MKRAACIILIFVLWHGIASAAEFVSGSYLIKDPVINIGSSFSTSSNFNLISSLGQEAVGISAGGTMTVKSGFLYFPAPAASPPVSPPASTPRVISGGGLLRPVSKICDFNRDQKCNILDLSIFLYWINRPIEVASPFDLNKDGRLNIVDISLIFYYWT